MKPCLVGTGILIVALLVLEFEVVSATSSHPAGRWSHVMLVTTHVDQLVLIRTTSREQNRGNREIGSPSLRETGRELLAQHSATKLGSNSKRNHTKLRWLYHTGWRVGKNKLQVGWLR